MVDRFRNFTLSLFEISRCWHKLASEELAKYGLKGPYAMYLVVLLHHPEGLTAANLCELCGRDKADVSRSLSDLLEKELICREGNHPYRAKVRLTDLGTQAAEHVCSRASIAVELAGKDISPEQRESFYQSLGSITDNLRLLSRQGLPES